MTWSPRICGDTELTVPTLEMRTARNGIVVVEITGPIWMVNSRGELTDTASRLEYMLQEDHNPILLVIDSPGGECRSAKLLGDILEKSDWGIAVHLRKACGSALLAAIECPLRFGEPSSQIGDLRESMNGQQITADIDPDYLRRRCQRRLSIATYVALTTTGTRFGGEMAEAYGLIQHLTPSVDATLQTLGNWIRNARYEP